MNQPTSLPRLYSELAHWWPILSAPADYAEEAEFYRRTLQAACPTPIKTMLELGSGGGNNASHLKQHVQMTLVDLSAGMLEVSTQLNSECEHIQGDMRSVRLGRQFDTVFIHDAIDYMQSEADLSRAIETAYAHCKPGGVALFAPDYTCETFKPSTDHGGHDDGARGLRYLEWTWDPDPTDTTYTTYMVYALREATGDVRCVGDLHICGLFSQATWLHLLAQAGFQARSLPFVHSEIELGSAHVFLGIKPS
jgi:ubiquinone/menaquinone biosynthesis C-methylase UbiE